MKRKVYTAPRIKSESIKIGVFGKYGGAKKPKKPKPFRWK